MCRIDRDPGQDLGHATGVPLEELPDIRETIKPAQGALQMMVFLPLQRRHDLLLGKKTPVREQCNGRRAMDEPLQGAAFADACKTNDDQQWIRREWTPALRHRPSKADVWPAGRRLSTWHPAMFILL
jgi:hypothetical protein